MGMERIMGVYLPSAKNSMVKEHYGDLGFTKISSAEDGSSFWSLEIGDFQPKPTFIQTVEGALDVRSDLHATH
jgi:predicted enzyme involved in methoxymalonyl-ACP biosynthesis